MKWDTDLFKVFQKAAILFLNKFTEIHSFLTSSKDLWKNFLVKFNFFHDKIWNLG